MAGMWLGVSPSVPRSLSFYSLSLALMRADRAGAGLKSLYNKKYIYIYCEVRMVDNVLIEGTKSFHYEIGKF